MNDLKSHFMMLLVGQSDGVKQSVILSDNQLDNDHTLPSSCLTPFPSGSVFSGIQAKICNLGEIT